LIHKCYLAKKGIVLIFGKIHFILAGDRVLKVAGTGKPLRQFIYSRDLAKLMIWALREYTEISPIILSVSEKDEVSISQVAESVVKAFAFNGKIEVPIFIFKLNL
jgi:GDP-L-fucose synthase